MVSSVMSFHKKVKKLFPVVSFIFRMNFYRSYCKKRAVFVTWCGNAY